MNILSLINQCLDNYYQIKTKLLWCCTVQYSEFGEPRIRHVNKPRKAEPGPCPIIHANAMHAYPVQTTAGAAWGVRQRQRQGPDHRSFGPACALLCAATAHGEQRQAAEDGTKIGFQPFRRGSAGRCRADRGGGDHGQRPAVARARFANWPHL
jgi:hypothetical protein